MDTRFYTVDGKVLNNLKEMIDYIKNSSNEIFSYHREHFAKWVIDIFGECRIALKLKVSKNKEEFLNKLEKLRTV